MNKVSKKVFSGIIAMASLLSMTGCTTSLKKYKGGSNEIVNQNGSGNTQAAAHVIYFNHIDGEGNFDNKNTEAGKLPAVVMFEYQAINDDYMGMSVETSKQHIKYQVSYIACNCRTPDFNAWTTMYVEMSATKDDLENPNGSRIINITFDNDSFEDDYGHATQAGHWGDSYAMDGNTNPYASEHAKEHGVHGATKWDFYEEIVPLLTQTVFGEGSTKKGITKEVLHGWMTESFNEEGFFEHEQIELFETTKVERYTATLKGTAVAEGKVKIAENEVVIGEHFYKDPADQNQTYVLIDSEATFTAAKAIANVEFFKDDLLYSAAKEEVSINDAYAGASVSLDNMLSMLDGLFEYHTTKLEKIAADSTVTNMFYTYEEDDGFQGSYIVEAADGKTTTHITKADLEAMKADKGTYLIYSASEGCSSCAAFSKPVNSYVKGTGQKVYEILHKEAKEVFPNSAISNLYAPQFFLISNGEVVAVLSQDDLDLATAQNSYKVIYKNFTKALLSSQTR
jgi:hypothetical protein